jgi:hypothetical protein
LREQGLGFIDRLGESLGHKGVHFPGFAWWPLL